MSTRGVGGLALHGKPPLPPPPLPPVLGGQRGKKGGFHLQKPIQHAARVGGPHPTP